MLVTALSLLSPVSHREPCNEVGSAASRFISVPFERYGCPKKSAQKVLVTLFTCIFHVKAKRNIVYEYLKTKFFSRDSNVLPRCIEHQIFVDIQLQLFGVFGYH